MSLRRRDFITLLGGAAAAWPLAAGAQQGGPIKRIAFVGNNDGFNYTRFRQELAKLGWVEGRDVRIETLFSSENRTVRASAPFVVSTMPDLIVVISTAYAEIFKELTDTIPVVFGFASDPVARKLVKSLASPGGNLTGFTNLPLSLAGKWLSLLKTLVPGMDRVMLLHDPANAGFLPVLQEAAPVYRVTVHSAPTTAVADAELAIETFAKEPGGGMIVIPYPLTIGERPTIVALAARNHLPAIYGAIRFADVGGLICYGENDDTPRYLADYADRILKGAKPADLPVQGPTRFKFIINAKTAKALGLTVPPTLLDLADEVIDE